MERATPVELRKSIEAANALKDAGIRFVPMPVLNEEDHGNLAEQMLNRMDFIERSVGSEVK